MRRSISILGATGSVGASTLDLVRRERDRWRVVALTANSSTEELAALARESLRARSKYGVQMHEFYLHEAQAQLQMALFGMDEGFMERTNKQIRQVFAGDHPDPERGFGAQGHDLKSTRLARRRGLAAARD